MRRAWEGTWGGVPWPRNLRCVTSTRSSPPSCRINVLFFRWHLPSLLFLVPSPGGNKRVRARGTTVIMLPCSHRLIPRPPPPCEIAWIAPAHLSTHTTLPLTHSTAHSADHLQPSNPPQSTHRTRSPQCWRPHRTAWRVCPAP